MLVVDMGGQYSQLIARRVRECRVYSELVPHTMSVDAMRARRPLGLILSGGPASVYADEAPQLDPGIYDLGVPMLGICYGMQLIAHQLDGEVDHTDRAEFGRSELKAEAGSALFEGLPAEQACWMSHRDSVVAPPSGSRVTASSPSAPIAAFEAPDRGLYGVQFHPEVVHTPHGMDILKNFLFHVADAPPVWTPTAVIEEETARIRSQVGSDRVLCALSGGVDSAVAALLVHRAVGEQLTCVFVDHGLLRKDEAIQVVETFERHFQVPLVHVDARERFLARLEGVTDPEEKRKRIGEEFIRVFEEESRRLGTIRHLVQGTLYSDVIESGGSGDGVAATIKSHHNVGGLPEEMDFHLVEPLRMLFKDEVRRVGEELGLPDGMVWRQPFPGPGLAIRIIGEVTEERLELVREADAVLQEEIRRAGLYKDLWQSFCVLPAVRSVGVQGDGRTYAYPIVIRAVTSDDAMTADWARLPYDLLETISSRIINEIPGINRVALDLSSKPPATIEWEYRLTELAAASVVDCLFGRLTVLDDVSRLEEDLLEGDVPLLVAADEELQIHSEVLELLLLRVLHDRARLCILLECEALLVPADRLRLFDQGSAHASKRPGLIRQLGRRFVVLLESHLSLLLIGVKPSEPLRLLLDGIDPVHACGRRSFARDREQPLDCVRIALENRLQGSIGLVLGPPRDALLRRVVGERGAEEDSLDAPVDNDSAPDHASRSAYRGNQGRRSRATRSVSPAAR